MDDAYIQKVFRIDVTHKKDPSQRKACGCVVSKDIGVYDTCLFECQYCYATSNFSSARDLFREHKPDWKSLNGDFDATIPENNDSGPSQPPLFEYKND